MNRTGAGAFTSSAASTAYHKTAALTGVGFTDFTRKSGRSVLALALEACRNAIADCGLTPGDVDGIVSYSFYGDSVGANAIATGLAMPRLNYSLDISLGGQAPCLAVLQAAIAIRAGLAQTVVVFRAMNGRSGYRLGRATYSTPTAQYRYPVGLTGYAQLVAMWAQRYMILTGTDEHDFAAVVMAQRNYAEKNERAVRRRQLTLDDYLTSPLFVTPLRVVDCTIEVDGACAVVVTSHERALDLPHRPVRIDGGAWVSGPRAGYDVGDVFAWEDLSTNFTALLADQLWASSGRGPNEIDFAQIYDCFSPTVLFGLEGLGFAGRGDAGAFVRDGHTHLGGRLPLNTNGGLLTQGYLQGMNTVAEAVLQIQRRCELRQIPTANVGVVTSGALTDGSAMVLSDGTR